MTIIKLVKNTNIEQFINKNLNELGMNDANRAYRLNKTHINLNKLFKSIEINESKFYCYRGGIKKIDGINIGKNLEKGWSKT